MTSYQGASASGSISRKRVGSLSQRGGNETVLTPLDIQSIQMPSNPQNALALKTAALATTTKSLFQTCSTLRKRLRCVEDFQPFLDQPPGAEPLDVVSHMCHTFRLGSPLCHLYNLLIPSFTEPSSPLFASAPAPKQIEYDFPQFIACSDGVKNWAKRPENAKMCQKYIALFCIAMKQRKEEGRWHGDIWAIHELWGKSTGDEADGYDSTGLMKVLHTIEAMIDNLPESAMSPVSPPTPYTTTSHRQYGSMSASSHGHGHRTSYDIPFSMGGTGPGSTAVANMAATMNGGVRISEEPTIIDDRGNSSVDANAFKSVEELVSSEKSYVHELEILVRYAAELQTHHIISAENSHKIFANLSGILEFHRKFLIKLETEYEPIEEGNGPHAWAEGSWGRPFIMSEDEFGCYGPYCANYLDAIGIINEQMPNLLHGQDLPPAEQPCLHPERELQAFMIKPIQRITKYGLLLSAIMNATSKHEYPFRPELEEGIAAVRRIADRVNDITDFKAKQATIRELQERVEDWKGHEIVKFGDLWLDDHFTVTKAEQPRDYHVFLFEKMMLCCKEVGPDRKDRKNKNSAILRKDKGMSKGTASNKPKLALKGRIFVSNINRATLNSAEPSDPTAAPRLTISWTVPHRHASGYVEDMADSFVMIGRSDEAMKKWADKVMELATIERRKQEEARAARGGRHSTSSSAQGHYSQQSSFAPPTPATETPSFNFPPPMPNGAHPYSSAYSANGHFDDDDDAGLRSGRTTPSIGMSTPYVAANPNTGRRVQSQQAAPAPADRAELRARAMTEDQFGPSMTQWRSHQPPPMPRLASNASASSEASFGQGSGTRGGLRMNTSRLDMAEEMDEEDENESAPQRFASARGMARAPSHAVASSSVPYPAQSLRSRSASSPNVHQAQTLPKLQTMEPPIPNMSGSWAPEQPSYTPSERNNHGSGSSTTLVGGTAYFAKRMSAGNRSSGGSQTTETSETTSSQSPATPYGMMAGELRGVTPVSRQNSGDGTVLLRVKAGDNAFIVSVSTDINYATLYQKVLKKIRLGRSVGPNESIQLKWVDTDEDEVSLRCDADIEAMFGEVKDSGMGHVNIIAK